MTRLQALRAAGLLMLAEGDGAGGDGAGGDSGANGTPSPADLAAKAAADKAAADKAAADAAANGTGDGGANGDDSPWNDPEKAKREIDRLRRENGDARMNAKREAAAEARSELLKELGKFIDPASGDEAPTAEALAAKVVDANVERDDAKRDAALVVAAVEAGVDVARLDYLRFILSRRAEFSAIDPADAEAGATLKTLISEEITKDSSLKTSGTARGTGDTQFGGANSGKQITLDEFKAMSLAERTELYRSNRAEYDRLVAVK